MLNPLSFEDDPRRAVKPVFRLALEGTAAEQCQIVGCKAEPMRSRAIDQHSVIEDDAMAGHRALWKGTLAIGKVEVAVGLYTAASTSERISFNIVNKATGNRVKRIYVDEDTGKEVVREEQTKGFETTSGDYILIDPEEVAAALPDSDKTLSVQSFVECDAIDKIYFDKPYYLVPERDDVHAFAAIRGTLKTSGTVAIARAVLFRRMRSVLIRPHGRGLIATTLNFDYEVRSAASAFKRIKAISVEDEMLDLAKHIIGKKMGDFDPASFEDRYEAALALMVKAKVDGKPLPKRKKVQVSKPSDLLAALRESAGKGSGPPGKGGKKKAANTNRKKASPAPRPSRQRKTG
jgi:DNA end-binding protein Ku